MKAIPQFLFLAFLLFNSHCYSQPNIEGKAIFEIQYKYNSPMAKVLPTEETIWFSGNIIRNQASVPNGIAVKGLNFIFFKDSMQYYSLYTMGREINGSRNFAILENGAPIKINKPEDSRKTILGYKCKLLTAESLDGKRKIKMYYTEAIGTSYLPIQAPLEIKNVFVLEYEEENTLGIKRAKAKSVELNAVPVDMFQIPEGFKKISREDFQKLSGRTTE
jgi:hypothetical protein